MANQGMGGGLGFQSIINSLQDMTIAINGLRTLMSSIFPTATATISHSATTGPTDTLPAKPQGFITVMVNGTPFKVPIYNI